MGLFAISTLLVLVLVFAVMAPGEAPRAPMPSGMYAPRGDLRGWRMVFHDDFSGSHLDKRKWRGYSGTPGGDPFGWFAPSHLSVAGGKLLIDGYQDAALGGKWATGGVSTLRRVAQRYGKYQVRYRFDGGVGVSHAVLLWPADQSWPPEIDFSEDSAHDHPISHATLHYGRQDKQIARRTRVNLDVWHTFGVEWTPRRLVYTLDGRAWASVRSRGVPSIPMVLAIQTQAWGCGISTWEGCVGPRTPARVRLEVDWVVSYARMHQPEVDDPLSRPGVL
jgi:beta-glucanase (GH16 family)